MEKAPNVIYVGKKPLMTYVTATLVQLANTDLVTIKARGKSIVQAVDISQIIEKRMGGMGYNVKELRIGSEQLQSQDGRTRNVSTIEIDIVKGAVGGGGSGDAPASTTEAASTETESKETAKTESKETAESSKKKNKKK